MYEKHSNFPRVTQGSPKKKDSQNKYITFCNKIFQKQVVKKEGTFGEKPYNK